MCVLKRLGRTIWLEGVWVLEYAAAVIAARVGFVDLSSLHSVWMKRGSATGCTSNLMTFQSAALSRGFSPRAQL